MKAKQKYEMAKEMNDRMTKPVGINKLMKMPKKEFTMLWWRYCQFVEADDELGDMQP